MSTTSTRSAFADEHAASSLFENPPVLVEVRFPGCGTSSDWHLCDDEHEFQTILASLAAGTEIHLSAVWDLRNPGGAVVLRKS